MLTTLRNMFRRRSEPDRGIFEFFDGEKVRKADPIEIWSRFTEATGGELDDLLRESCRPATPGLTGRLAEQARTSQRETVKTLHEGILKAFDVKPFDGEKGLLQAERIALAVQYLQFLSSLAGESRPTHASQQPTEASPAA